MQHYHNSPTLSASVLICGLFDQIYTFDVTPPQRFTLN